MNAPQPSAYLLADAINRLNQEGFEAHLADWLLSIVPYDNIVMLAYQQSHPPALLFSSIKTSLVLEMIETTYTQGAYLLDPFHRLHLEQWPEGMYRLSDIAPDQFKRNRYFKEYYQDATMVDEIGYITYPVDDVSIHISLGRDITSNQRFASRQVTAANDVAPIVCSLAKQHWRQYNGQHNALEKAIETKTFENLIEKLKTGHGIILSPRQAQVAELILKGHSSMSIGLQLSISPQTVKVFRKQLYKKCQISSQAELFNFMMPILSA